MAEGYVLGNDASEIERLEIQASLFEPITKQVLLNAGLKKGMRCIDIGCGSGSVTRLMAQIVGKEGQVVGVDFDDGYLSYCRSINKYANVDFVRDDICNSKLDGNEHQYDIVFSRFLFQHLRDTKAAMRSMKQLAKKAGGTIIIQELDHSPDSWFCYPENGSLSILRELYVKLVKKAGGDPLAGRKLYKLLLDESLDTSLECYCPCILMGHEPYSTLGWRITESLKPQILGYGLLSEKEYNKVYEDLKQLATDRESFVLYARFFSAVGRRK